MLMLNCFCVMILGVVWIWKNWFDMSGFLVLFLISLLSVSIVSLFF